MGDVIATFRPGRRCWAVASIHGEADCLAVLHGELDRRIGPGDILVYLGNFLGLGAAVTETVDELLVFRRALLARPRGHVDDIVYLRGSQEEMWSKLLRLQFAVNGRQVLEWMLENGVAPTLQAYGGSAADGLLAAGEGAQALSRWTTGLGDAMRAADGHYALLGSLRHAAQTDNLLFVNAGIDAALPLEEQGDSFWWGGMTGLDKPYGGYTRVVRGFARRHPGLEVGDLSATVDGGAGFGGTLIAACFDASGELADSIEV